MIIIYQSKGSGGGGTWGGITGTLADQTDLQAALDAKGSGDVSSAAVIADHAVVRGDGGAKGVQSSGVTIDDSDNVVTPGTLRVEDSASIQKDDTVNLIVGSHATNPLASITWQASQGTEASPQAITNFKTIGSFNFQGYGTTYRDAAKIQVLADQTHSATAAGGTMVISVTRRGGTTQEEYLRMTAGEFRINDGAAAINLRVEGQADTNLLTTNSTTNRVGVGTASPQGKLHSYDTGGGFLHKYLSGIVATPQTVIANGTGDVTLVLSGTFTVSDGAGNVAGGVITATLPSGSFDLYDDGGTNTCELQVAADGSVVVVRTAGSRTYACNLNLSWM